MADVRRLVELGMPTELAKEVASQIAAAGGAPYTDANARAAIATKSQIAALTELSTTGDIVAALKA